MCIFCYIDVHFNKELTENWLVFGASLMWLFGEHFSEVAAWSQLIKNTKIFQQDFNTQQVTYMIFLDNTTLFWIELNYIITVMLRNAFLYILT